MHEILRPMAHITYKNSKRRISLKIWGILHMYRICCARFFCQSTSIILYLGGLLDHYTFGTHAISSFSFPGEFCPNVFDLVVVLNSFRHCAQYTTSSSRFDMYRRALNKAKNDAKHQGMFFLNSTCNRLQEGFRTNPILSTWLQTVNVRLYTAERGRYHGRDLWSMCYVTVSKIFFF